MTVDAEVIIVGAGAGGPMVARALAEAGVSVLLLEAGPWLNPDRDYTRLENDVISMADGRMRWGPADRSRPPWARRRVGVNTILQAAGVGGTTQHYNGMAARAHPDAISADWPFGYDELVPYYEQVERMLPVHRVETLAPKDARFADGCRALHIPENSCPETTVDSWGHTFNAILPVTNSSTRGCTLCGHCLIGCPIPIGAPIEDKAKRASNVSLVPAAVATGRCNVIPDAFVTDVLTESCSDGLRVSGVRWRETRTGQQRQAHSRAVVLALGSIETPRLWLNSGLPISPAVGRYLTCHYPDIVTGFFTEPCHPDIGQATMVKADFPGRGVMWCEGFAPWGFAVGLTVGGSGFWDDQPHSEPWDRSGRQWGAAAVRQILRFENAVCVAISTDDEAVAQNNVTIAADWPQDEHGPVPAVEYRPTPTSAERRLWLARRAAEILRAAGAVEIIRNAPARAMLAHIMGTMRMGRDPNRSVVAPSGATHAVAGLFVADASVLANGLGGVPPSLTTQALALRTSYAVLESLTAGPRESARFGREMHSGSFGGDYGSRDVGCAGNGQAVNNDSGSADLEKGGIMASTREDVTRELETLFVEHFRVPRDKVTPEANMFDDLGMDSVDLMSAVAILEERHEISIPDEELSDLLVVGDCVDRIMGYLKKG